MQKIKMAQYGTKHGHAEGVLAVMFANPDVEVAGVYEPDRERRRELEKSGQKTWSKVRWYGSPKEFLDDPSIVAVSSEGRNIESLAQTEEIIEAGKHVFYDKPAGDNWPQWARVIEKARTKGLLIQLGYMFRHHDGFCRIADWSRSGFLGDVFSVRAHMSTYITEEQRTVIADHDGGIFYDLAGHMLDQVVWILGRPRKVTSFFQNVNTRSPNFRDNTLAVFEYENALAFVDIAAMEARPMARRFEVYGTRGSAIMEPFEPAGTLRLCLDEARGGYGAGENVIKIEDRPRYVASLAAFVRDLRGDKQPDRTLDHELLVQETLLRATSKLPA
ncbi:MAG: Gfo/Idh/MocA family oxidoreductase [Dehalococcoidia bacterium]|nr:Gfo/Idh/MocA family oxidoreductase [Dehalococcoidia bacterium]